LIIDGHTHLVPFSEQRLFTAEHLLKSMDEVGIDKALTFSIAADGHVNPLTYGREGLKGTGGRENEVIAKWLKQYPDRLMAFASINPLYGELAVEQLRRCVLKLGFKGIKLRPTQCGYWMYNGRHDKYVDAIMEQAVKLKLPILSHSDHYSTSAPYRMGWLADTYPDVTIIIGHMGGGGWDVSGTRDAVWVTKKHDNVYLETSSNSPYNIRRALTEVDAEKVIFGSDAPLNHHETELNNIKVLKLPGNQEQLILGENIAEIIKKVPEY
jgi:predicted TIM-barrel fold metal-dependent hydrolase